MFDSKIVKKIIIFTCTLLCGTMLFSCSDKTDSKNTVSNTDSQSAPLEGTSSDNTVSDTTASDDTSSGDTVSDTTASDDTSSGDTASDSTSSNDTSSDGAQSSSQTDDAVAEDQYTQLQTPPDDPEYYAPDVKLNHRSVTVYANMFKGSYDSVVFKDGGMTLADGETEGSFTSEDIDLNGEFSRLVCSWNAVTNDGTVEISVQAKKSDGSYTKPFSWGVWSSKSGVSSSANTSNSDGSVGIDILQLNETCSGTVRFTVTLTKTAENAPTLYCVTFATNKENGNLSEPDTCEVKLNVPKRLQGDVPRIGGRICSPTSLSMVLEYLGEKNLETEDTAYAVYDNKKDIFGNWSFNVAHAGEKGYNAIFDYYDIGAVKYSLNCGTPVICSIKIKAGQLAGSGFPTRSSNGHLLVVIGHTTVDGKDYFIINDPAVSPGCEIKLLVSEFETIWAGGCYILQQKPVK